MGVAGGDTGMRGYIASFSPSTGEELWRTYTIPAKGEPGSETWGKLIEYGGGATWLSGTYDPDLNTHLLDHRQSVAGLLRRRSRRRQSLLLFAAGARCRHREDEMVFPVHAARHARLGCAGLAGAGGPPYQGQDAEAGAARQPQRFSLCSRPRHRRVPERDAAGGQARLGQRDRRQRPADSGSGQGPDADRQPRLSGRPRARPTGCRRPSIRRPACFMS